MPQFVAGISYCVIKTYYYVSKPGASPEGCAELAKSMGIAHGRVIKTGVGRENEGDASFRQMVLYKNTTTQHMSLTMILQPSLQQTQPSLQQPQLLDQLTLSECNGCRVMQRNAKRHIKWNP